MPECVVLLRPAVSYHILMKDRILIRQMTAADAEGVYRTSSEAIPDIAATLSMRQPDPQEQALGKRKSDTNRTKKAESEARKAEAC